MTKNSNQGGPALNLCFLCFKQRLNPIRAGFLELRRAGGGGGHKVPPPPPSKNPVPRLRIYPSKVFLKACPNWVLWSKLGFHGNHGYGLRWFIVFRFLTRNHHSKIKNLVPLNKSKKSNFFWKHMKNWIEWHHWCCHGGGSVHFKVNEARKRVRNENCHQDAI